MVFSRVLALAIEAGALDGKDFSNLGRSSCEVLEFFRPGTKLPTTDATAVPKKKSPCAELKRGTLCVGSASRSPTSHARGSPLEGGIRMQVSVFVTSAELVSCQAIP